MEYIQAICFTKPNHDGATVMSLGTAKSAIAASIFGEGNIRSNKQTWKIYVMLAKLKFTLVS